MYNSKQNIALNEQVLDYSFGMLMPGRSYTSENYRFGFNGMEKDDEVMGEGIVFTLKKSQRPLSRDAAGGKRTSKKWSNSILT